MNVRLHNVSDPTTVIPRYVDLLLKQLGSSDWEVVQTAIRCLGQVYPYILSVLFVSFLFFLLND